MLTPQQLQAIAKQRGDAVINPNAGISGTPTVNPAEEFAKRIGFDPSKSTVQSQLEQEGKQGYLKGLLPRVAAEQVAGANKVVKSVKKGAEDMQKSKDQFDQGGIKNRLASTGNYLKGAAEAGFGTISGVAEAAFAPVTAVVEPIAAKTIPLGIKMLKANHPMIAKLWDSVPEHLKEDVATKVNALAEQHPDATTLAGDVANTLLLAVGGPELEAPLKESLTKEGLSVAKKSLSQAPVEIASAVKGAGEKITTNIAEKFAPKSDTLKIQEMISPKPTATEAKLATKQGRLIKGKEPTFLRGGTEDTVIPSDEVIKSAQTIENQIPNAANMDEAQLYTAVDTRTGEIARGLKPEMQKVKIQEKTVEQITNDWEKLKKSQIENADATEEANVLKSQKQFESRLQKSKSGTIDDLWETRKEYDASVPDNVKKANSLSSDSLQNKKEIWLQNRAVLNDAINNSDIGEVSRQAFDDMNSLYNARENLLSKSKIVKTPKPSKLIQGVEYLKKHPIGTIGTGLGVYEAIKHL